MIISLGITGEGHEASSHQFLHGLVRSKQTLLPSISKLAMELHPMCYGWLLIIGMNSTCDSSDICIHDRLSDIAISNPILYSDI